jgi:hypothetical protein
MIANYLRNYHTKTFLHYFEREKPTKAAETRNEERRKRSDDSRNITTYNAGRNHLRNVGYYISH